VPDTSVTVPTGSTTLAGALRRPAGEGPWPAALLVAGSGPLDRDGNIRRMRLNLSADLAALLESLGWASLRFDKRGVGDSAGDYLATGFYDELDDADAAYRWLASHPDVDGVVVIGHSAGATFATELAVRHSELAGVVALALTAATGEETLVWQAEQIAGSLPRLASVLLRIMRTDVLRQQRATLDKIRGSDADVMRIQGARVNSRWMREFMAYDPKPTLQRVTVPMLALTGSKDVQVDPDGIEKVASLVPSAEAHVLADVDHLLRHEPAATSDVRRYRAQVRRPIAEPVVAHLTDWLQRLREQRRTMSQSSDSTTNRLADSGL
jgi:pimeloyl-ACP methyl ester carboxylesterase